MPAKSKEHERLSEVRDDNTGWRAWGPYVSERAWATVREDYSVDGDAWNYLPHDLARSKAYRWGEDGIAGICDRYQLLVFAPAFWNGRDAILKERLFGLTSTEGNHGEDVKEYYFHLDNTPTHSYMKYLYKYPQAEFPYARLIEENRRRNGQGFEFELLDTGIFDDNRYFDIVIEYAKAGPDDLCIRIEAFNRGPEPAELHLLPHLWFRNTWAWGGQPSSEPTIHPGAVHADYLSLVTDDSKVETISNIPISYRLGARTLFADLGGDLLFTNNETNAARIYGPAHLSRSPYVKDAFHRHVLHGEPCLNPQQVGTKAALHYRFPAIPPGGSVVRKLRLSAARPAAPLAEVEAIVALRRREADEFYATIHPPGADEDERQVQRQALAGLLWTKMSYLFDVDVWLKGDNPATPPPESRRTIRNQHWQHLNSMRVLTVCDKWEYPWFAAWDLAFQCVAFAVVDAKYAKEQLWLLLFEQFQHPNGQIPAYEWEFSDLNPPVHAWAVWRVYNKDRYVNGVEDRDFLERCFHKLLINFAWWINKVDREGNNIFEGGFLGMDNITVVDRSVRSADGAVLDQSDGSGYMGMFCLNMMRIALELARKNPTYEALAVKFFQHYAYVAHAMKHMGNRDYQLWDEQDGFFYDVLRYPNSRFRKFRVRSLVGLIPLFAVERLEAAWIEPFKEFSACFYWFLKNRRNLVERVVHKVEQPDGQITYVLTILDQGQVSRLMDRLCDEREFLSDYGIRSLSKSHEAAPFEFDGQFVGYEPAESVSKLKGGNSNWRGPIWFPTTFLLIESLRKLGKAYGATLRFPPVGRSGTPVSFAEFAQELADRLVRIFKRDAEGRRPMHGGSRKFQEDPHWRDHMLFYEYFHGDNGAGLGASHQTGWTALIAAIIDEWRSGTP
jgi:hypothetical protein